MKRPLPRGALPARDSDNDKRRLGPIPEPEHIARLREHAQYKGSPKHKANPRAFGLPQWDKSRGDATLCDSHAGFSRDAAASIPGLLRRGIDAGPIGHGDSILWTVGDDGWIFEGRITNAEQGEYHGYPVRPSEAIAQAIFERFAAWARDQGKDVDREAATRCQELYGFKS